MRGNFAARMGRGSPFHSVSALEYMTFSFAQIDQGIDSLVKNASQLIAEANTLLGVSAFARAFALAHLAREELSKVTMLYSAGGRMAAGHEVDWQSLMKRLRDHKAKLRMETVENALFMIGNGLTEKGEESLSNITAVSEYRNSQKNDSLYVGFTEGRFILPQEAITEHKARRTVKLAELRLQQQLYMQSKVPSFVQAPERAMRAPPVLKDLDDTQLKELINMTAKAWAQHLREIENANPAVNTDAAQ
jgi:AbiV family abortive infection protein